MGQTKFSGPVKSEGGFLDANDNPVGGGGDANNLGVFVDSTPSSPVTDNYWYERTSPVPITSITSTIPRDAGGTTIVINVPSADDADFAALGSPNDLSWSNTSTQPPTVTEDIQQILIDYSGTTTVQEVLDELNTFSQARISKNWASLGTALGTDNFSTSTNGDGSASIDNDGAPETLIFKFKLENSTLEDQKV